MLKEQISKYIRFKAFLILKILELLNFWELTLRKEGKGLDLKIENWNTNLGSEILFCEFWDQALISILNKYLRFELIPFYYYVMVIPCRDTFNWGIKHWSLKIRSAHIRYRDQACKINNMLTKIPISALKNIVSILYLPT